MSKIKWASLTAEYTDVPYELGGTDSNGLDCLTLMGKILEEIGKTIDWEDEYKGYNIENYKKLPHKKLMGLLYEYITNKTHKIEIKEMRNGDILLVKLEGKKYYMLYVGNNKCISVQINEGVKIFKIMKGMDILEVRRWL